MAAAQEMPLNGGFTGCIGLCMSYVMIVAVNNDAGGWWEEICLLHKD